MTKINTLCDGSGLSSINSSRFPDIALLISGPASCKVRKPAYIKKKYLLGVKNNYEISMQQWLPEE